MFETWKEMKKGIIVLHSDIMHLASDSGTFDQVVIKLDRLECIHAGSTGLGEEAQIRSYASSS